MNITQRIMQKVESTNRESSYVSVRLQPQFYYMLEMMAFLDGSSVSSVITDDIEEVLLKIVLQLLSDMTDEESVEFCKLLPPKLLWKLEQVGIIEEKFDFSL